MITFKRDKKEEEDGNYEFNISVVLNANVARERKSEIVRRLSGSL